MKSKYITLRLVMAFAALIILLLGIGQLGLRRMQEIDATLSDITGRQSTDLQLARKALMISNDNSRIAMEIVLVENRALVNTLLAKRSQNSEEITRLIEESGKRCKSEEERQLLLKVKKTRQPYVESYLRAIHLLVDQGKHRDSEGVMVNETLPALLKYHAAWEEFVEFQNNEVDAAVKQAEVHYARARRLAFLLIGLAVGLAITIAIFTTRDMTSEIAARIAAKNEVSNLNATLEARVEQRTRELSNANKRLASEVDERRRAQASYQQEAAARESAELQLQRREERMRVAMEAANLGLWDWDVITDEQVWSDTCKALLGLQPASTANFEVLMNSVHPDDRKGMKENIDGAIRERREYALEFRVVWPDGSVHWQAARGRAFYDSTGRTTRMAGISMDIDERKYAEERLHLQAAALEAAANAIVITDSRGKITWVNHAFTTMTGYSKEEAMGKNPRLLKSGDQPEAYCAELWSTISSGKVWQGQIVNRRKDGTTYNEEMTITPVTQGVGKAVDTHFIAIKQDVTERKRAQESMEESERLYRLLFENMLEGFAHCEMLFDDRGCPTDYVYLAVNSAFGKLTGLEKVVGRRFSEVIPGDESQSELLERYGRVTLTGEPERFEIEVKTLGRWFSVSAYAAANGCFVATFDNITERKQAEEALLFKTALLEAQTETTIDGMLAVDESDQIILTNKQFGLNFGIPDELLRTRDDLIVRKYVADRVEAPDTFVERVKYLNSHRDEHSRDELRFKNGKIFDRYSAPLVDPKGQYRGRIWYFRDITDRKVAEERVQFLAYYDALTGLPNRALLRDRLATAVAGARRRKDKVALLFLDLDRFKRVNDSLGHSVGDLLLQEVAERLKTFGREHDTVARLGGDEFLVVLNAVKDVSDAAVAADRLVKAVTAGFDIQGHPITVTCSLGISIFPEHGANGETLIKNADAAMYCAKENGRNNVQFFTEDMNAEVVERLTLENSLRQALDKKELFLMYQPQMDIATRKITGLEALLRWQHPELGLVPPDKFIRIAEYSGLIMPIGEWVLRSACSQARKWQDEGIPPVSVAVNVSAVQFRQDDFCELIRTVLLETGLAPRYLELELTESLLLANADVMLSVVEELNAMGLTLAIDDFGTGYSNFGYLKQFRISKLKIDRSFVRDIAVNPDDAAIAGAIISMAKSLNLKVIAEGVEDEAQMSFLRAHQCDEIQGYYFSKPLTVEKVADKLRGECSVPKVRAQASGRKS